MSDAGTARSSSLERARRLKNQKGAFEEDVTKLPNDRRDRRSFFEENPNFDTLSQLVTGITSIPASQEIGIQKITWLRTGQTQQEKIPEVVHFWQ